jgi:hypothetical protein
MRFANEAARPLVTGSSLCKTKISKWVLSKTLEKCESHSTCTFIIIVAIEYATKERAVPWGPISLASIVRVVFDSRGEYH